MTFLSQPIIEPVDASAPARARLVRLIERAKSATNHDESLRIVCFGDSTFTDIGGAGIFLMHLLTEKLGSMFGNIAGSRLAGVATNNLGTPYVRTTRIGGLGAVFASNRGVPGLATSGGAHVEALPAAGESTHAPHLTLDTSPSEQAIVRKISPGSTLFPAANCRLEIYGAKRDNSAASLTVNYRPTNKAYTVQDGTESSQTITFAGIDSDETDIELVKVTTAGYAPVTGKPTPQWEFRSGEATTSGAGSKAPFALASVRVLNANPVGCILDSFSAGGLRTLTWLGDTNTGAGASYQHATKEAVQYGHDVWIFGLGANDHYNSSSTSETRRHYYDPDGTNNKGLIGELIAECEADGRTVPLIVVGSTPYRARLAESAYASMLAIHEAFAAEMIAMVQELRQDGYDAIFLNVHRHTYQRGFNETINAFHGLNDRGNYDTDGASYAVNDVYVGSDGLRYRCLVAHTSTSTTDPAIDGQNNLPEYHLLNKVHLADQVHWTLEGSELVADSYADLFATHFDLPVSSGGCLDPAIEIPIESGNRQIQWPVASATITGTVQWSGQTAKAITGLITFRETVAGKHFYDWSYNAADRPSASAVGLLTFTDGSRTIAAPVRFQTVAAEGGDATAANQQTIINQLLTADTVQVPLPNARGSLELIQGDTYDGIANPKASWTVSTDYTDGWSVRLTIRDSDDAAVYTVAGEAATTTRIEVPIVAPTGLAMEGCPGVWQGKFDVELSKAGSVVTIALGKCYISEDQSR